MPVMFVERRIVIDATSAHRARHDGGSHLIQGVIVKTFRYCKQHGIHEGKVCPKCPKAPPAAVNPKYTTSIIIPPHMRAGR